jgi:phage terminase Nu1 subunit (DNA packaging protein)
VRLAGRTIEGVRVVEWATQAETARMLDVTPRHVQRLEAKGLPAEGARDTKRYPIPHVVIWWSEYVIAQERAGEKGVEKLPFSVAYARDRLFWAEKDAGLL